MRPLRAQALAPAAAFSLALALACSRGGDDRFAGTASGPATAPAAFDWDRPASALDLGADEVAARLGSFEWSATVDWSVTRDLPPTPVTTTTPNPPPNLRRVHAVEQHRVRQSAAGEFEAALGLDPGLGAGSESGRDVVFAGGLTYARARPAPFRERPTDHGRDARRFRDESFRVARSVALLAPLALTPAGEVDLLRRRARRYTVALAKDAPAPARPKAADAPDPDTKLRRAFAESLRARSVQGEVLLDAQTGVPLRVRLQVAFGVEGDAAARAAVEVTAQVKGLGADVAPIAAPPKALPDERKAQGTSTALEAVGLKKRGETRSGREGEDAAEE